MLVPNEQFLLDRAQLDPAHREATVVHVSSPLGDLHDGEAVRLIGLSNGHELVLKPKPSRIERKILSFLGLASVRIDDFETRSYWPALANVPPQSASAWRDFLEAYGYLVGLAWQLGAFDLHWGNVLVHDGLPVPVDVELFSEMTSPVSRPITATGLVPYVHKLVGGVPVDQSPLAEVVGRVSPDAWPRTAANDLAAGFRRALAETGRIVALRSDLVGLPVRRIFRPTRTYARLVTALASGEADTSEVMVWLEMTASESPELAAIESRDTLAAFVAFETSELLLGNVPKFGGRFGSDELLFAGKSFTVAKETGGEESTNGFREELRLIEAFRSLETRMMKRCS